MPNSSYSIMLTNDGAGTFTPVARRSPSTTPSGGTALTIPYSEFFKGSTSTTTELTYLAADACKRAIENDTANKETNSYSIMLTNDGAGVITPVVRRAPTTTPSGGTALDIPDCEFFAGSVQTTTKLLYLAADACKRAILNDISAGN